MVKKSKMVPTPAPTPEPVPPHIEAMASTWYEYDAMNPTAASLRNAVKEIICSRYDVAWCAIDEGYWATALLQTDSDENDQDLKPAVKPSPKAEAKATKQQEQLQNKMQQKDEKIEAQQQMKREKKEAQQQLKKEMKDAKVAAQKELKDARKGTESVPEAGEALF